MTDDPFLNFITGVVAVSCLGLSWAISAASIASDCKTIGLFRVNDIVYECKMKGK